MLFDPATGDVALVIVAPDAWVIEDSELDQMLDQWTRKFIDGA